MKTTQARWNTVASLLFSFSTLAFLPNVTQAQSDKPLKIILANGAGSGVDTIVRTAQPALSKALGQPVVIENQAGAGGITGASMVAKATPDGYTIGIVSNNHVINPSLGTPLSFDSINDFVQISILGASPIVLVVNPKKVTSNNLKEFITLLKANPGKYNYASSGNGTILHLAGELFKSQASVFAVHIPYRAVGPMVTDIIGGQVDYGFLALASVQQHIKSGALKVLGVGSPTRVPAAPDVPTLQEGGLPNYEVAGWLGVIAPKGFPPAQTARLNAAFVAAYNDPAVKDAMAKQGNVMAPSTSAVAAAYFRSELQKYAELVKRANVKVD